MAFKDKLVKRIKGLFNFEHPDNNVLVQHVECGIWVRIYPGFKGAVAHRNGYVSVHDSGFMFVPPLATADIVADHSLSRSFKYADTKITKDNVTVEAKEEISYEYRALPDAASIIKIVKEPNADSIINQCVSDIVKLIVTNSTADQIKYGFDISSNQIPSWLNQDAKNRLRQIYDRIKRYGCELDFVHICDFNEPEDIIAAETERKKMQIQLGTEEERVRRQRAIDLYRAQTENIILTYHYRVLAWVAKSNNLTPEETFELIKVDLLKQSNVVNVIGGNGNGQIDSLAAAVFARYQQLGLMDKEKQGNATDVKDDTAGYSDGGHSFHTN